LIGALPIGTKIHSMVTHLDAPVPGTGGVKTDLDPTKVLSAPSGSTLSNFLAQLKIAGWTALP